MAAKTLIVGNWKMHGTLEETLKLIAGISNKLAASTIDVAIAPPFTTLYSASVVLQETALKLCGQNMHWETEGPFTGEVSGMFLKDVGCSYVILGHSERRRHFHETDEEINRKILAAFAQDLIPIFCIGETLDERKAGKTESVLENQIKKGIVGVPMSDAKNLVLAYEPVWAIGTGHNATPDEIEKSLSFIYNFLSRLYDAPTAGQIPLLYGGSVSPENSKSIFGVKNVGGLLVGGASLNAEKFLKIIESH